MKCPKCNGLIGVYGSDSYPDSGVTIEHEEDDYEDCDFDINLKINYIIPRDKSFKEAIEMVLDYFYNKDNRDNNK